MAPKRKPDQPEHNDLLSFRVTKEIGQEFRVEAARRGKHRNDLFQEIWEMYKERRDGTD
jgi:hypothetical protein